MKKTPFLSKEQLQTIEKTYPTPFHLYDEKGIRENARRLKKAFSWNKGYREYFAVKATPNPFILKILQEEGCGVDCSSYTELMLSDAVGFKKSDIMFSSNVTPMEEYNLASELGAYINLDDYTHIDFLANGPGIPETVCCRYNPGGIFSLGTDIMDNPGDAKYGFTKEQLIDGYKKLMKLGAKNFGLHSFIASNTVSNDYYPTLAGILFELAVELKEKTGASIQFINLSGGIGIPYTPDKEPNDIAIIGEGVRKKFEEILVPAGLGDVAIFTELGRFMLGPYGQLVTKAIHEKHIYKEYIGLNTCACDLMRPAMYGAYHHITVLGKEDAPCDHKYDITGSLCENNDKFAVDRMLPKIDLGDYIVLHDTGAHGYAMGYNYNGKLKSPELLLKEDGSIQMIRRGKDIRNGLVAILSIKHPDPQFESQTKNKLGNTDAKTAVDDVMNIEVQRYFDKNVEVLKKILENAMKSYQARRASDKARTAVMKQLVDVETRSKLASCSSKKAEECEVYIVEGDSAGGTVKTARNRKTQAVLPLRGKILNVEKAPLEKILLNNEIKTMIAAFGCGIGDEFDIKKLKYDKIIILTDADVDGAHISTLLLTFFYRFMPELILEGKVYRGLPPLYRVEYNKAKKSGSKMERVSEYLFNDFELEKFRKHGGRKILGLQRYKGLGEMDAEQLWETTLDPETRQLARVSISDSVEADEITSMLMGSQVPPRRQFIIEEAKYAKLDL